MLKQRRGGKAFVMLWSAQHCSGTSFLNTSVQLLAKIEPMCTASPAWSHLLQFIIWCWFQWDPLYPGRSRSPSILKPILHLHAELPRDWAAAGCAGVQRGGVPANRQGAHLHGGRLRAECGHQPPGPLPADQSAAARHPGGARRLPQACHHRRLHHRCAPSSSFHYASPTSAWGFKVFGVRYGKGLEGAFTVITFHGGCNGGFRVEG